LLWPTALFIAALAGNQTVLLAQDPDSPAQETTPAAPETPQEAPSAESQGLTITDEMVIVVPANRHVDLVFMNRKITQFRAEIMGLPPSDRVADAANRLRERVDSGAIDTVGTLKVGQAILVLVDERPVLVITKGDLDHVVGETLESRAAEAVANLERALAEVSELSKPRELAIGLVATLIATALYVLLMWTMRKLRRAIEQRFVKATDTKLRKSVAGRIATATEQRPRIINLSRRVVSLLFVTAALVITYLWLAFVLQRFPFTRPWGEALGDFLVGTASWMGNGIVAAIPGLFVVFVIVALTRTACRVVDAVFGAVEAGRIEVRGIYPETALVTRRLVVTAL
jgi:hypothetical protein